MTKPLSQHILPSSATMVGVCLTSIGLIKIIEQKIGGSHVDEYLALNSVIFLASAIFSYLSIRERMRQPLIERLEKVADLFFLSGLSFMVIIAILFAYEII